MPKIARIENEQAAEIARLNSGFADSKKFNALRTVAFRSDLFETDGTSLYVAGVAANFAPGDFGAEFNILAPILGANENSKALWFWINALRSLDYRILRRLGISQEKIEQCREYMQDMTALASIE